MNARTRPGRVTELLVGLIVAATVAFAIGAAIEKSHHHAETTSTTSTGVESPTGAGSDSGGETPTEHAAEGGGTETPTEHAGETHSEKLLGLDPEATPLVIVAVIASLLLAVAVWFRPRHILLLALIAAAMFLFAALDIREAIHQSDESDTGLMILASAIAALHLGAGALAVLLASSARRPGTA